MTKISLEKIPRNMRIHPQEYCFSQTDTASRVKIILHRDCHVIESDSRGYFCISNVHATPVIRISIIRIFHSNPRGKCLHTERNILSPVPGFHFYFHSLLFGGGKQPMFRSFAFTYLSIFKGELVFFNGRTIVGYNVGDSRTIIKRDQSSWKLATKEK